MVSRTVTAIVTASMLTFQCTPKFAYAENQMAIDCCRCKRLQHCRIITVRLAWMSSARSRSPTRG